MSVKASGVLLLFLWPLAYAGDLHERAGEEVSSVDTTLRLRPPSPPESRRDSISSQSQRLRSLPFHSPSTQPTRQRERLILPRPNPNQQSMPIDLRRFPAVFVQDHPPTAPAMRIETISPGQSGALQVVGPVENAAGRGEELAEASGSHASQGVRGKKMVRYSERFRNTAPWTDAEKPRGWRPKGGQRPELSQAWGTAGKELAVESVSADRKVFNERIKTMEQWEEYRRTILFHALPSPISKGNFDPISAKVFQARIDRLNDIKM